MKALNYIMRIPFYVNAGGFLYERSSRKKIPVSIVMPVYNEEEIIEKTVRDYHAEIFQLLPESEMVIVDDCSTDNTHEILNKLSNELDNVRILKTARNGGHGKALRLAYENAAKTLVFHTDSDYQFDPKDFWKLYNELEHYDLIIGYRTVRHDPLPRLIITNILRLSNMVLFGFNMRDANCPFRIIRKDCLEECLKIIDSNAFASSIMLAIAAKWKGYRIKEVPVTHLHRLTGEVSIRKWKLLKACVLSLSQNFQLKRALRNF